MANYIRQSLEADEKIILSGCLHWSATASYIITALLLCFGAIGVAAYAYVSSITSYYYVALAMLVIALIIWYIGDFLRRRSEFAITTSRFIQKDGIVNIKMTEIPLFKVETVNFYQSLWQRLLGTGSIELVGSGGTFHRVECITNPMKVRKTIVHAIGQQKDTQE